MKTIRIKFVGFWPYFNETENRFLRVLRKHYNVELSENPDYIFCSMFGNGFYEYTRYDCVRIFVSGENYSPDFTVCDYGMGYDKICYLDRYLHLPTFFLLDTQDLFCVKRPSFHEAQALLANQKKEFCNFIYGDSDVIPQREGLFRALSSRKKVASAGTWLNNQNGFTVDMLTSKLEFQKKFRFTIAVESCSLPGFITEKLTDAFMANTIPIYYGDPTVGEIFNEKAFVNGHRFVSLEAVADEVMQIESDPIRMAKMLSEPIFNNPSYLEDLNTKFEAFLTHIFDQDPSCAFRRPKNGQPKVHNDYLRFTSRVLASKKYRNYVVRKSYANKYLPWLRYGKKYE